MSEKRITFRLAAYTDPAGKWSETAPKKGNEDDLFVDSDLSAEVQGSFVADKETELSDAGCLMVVADGMGGMNAGEVASAIAIETVRTAFEGKNLTSEVLASSVSRVRYMESVVVRADAAVKKKSKEDPSCEGMGSTLIMAWLYGGELSVTWCGDSRAYLFREPAGIRQLSKDHSYVQSLVDKGNITEVEAFDHPYGNIITRNLGDPEKKAVPDSVTLPVYKGDIILVCSDGLSGVLRDRKSYDREGNLIPGDNLEDIIRANRQSMTSCREALWSAAEAADWYDNVTAILCEITEGEDAPTVPSPIEESFFSVRIRKKVVKKVIISIVALLFVTATVFAVRNFYPKVVNKGEDAAVFVQLRDSLLREAELCGMEYICQRLSDVEIADMTDSAGIDMLYGLKDELALRYRICDSLDVLRRKAENSGAADVVDMIDDAVEYLKTHQNIDSIDILGISELLNNRSNPESLPKSEPKRKLKPETDSAIRPQGDTLADAAVLGKLTELEVKETPKMTEVTRIVDAVDSTLTEHPSETPTDTTGLKQQGL